jgi:hypothetical protein
MSQVACRLIVASSAKMSRPRPEPDVAGNFAAASRNSSIFDLVLDFGAMTAPLSPG